MQSFIDLGLISNLPPRVIERLNKVIHAKCLAWCLAQSISAQYGFAVLIIIIIKTSESPCGDRGEEGSQGWSV